MSTTLPSLSPAIYSLAEHGYRRHSVTPPANYSTSDLESPSTWAHLRTRFRTFDEIRAVADDGSWYALLVVVFCQDGVLRIKELYRFPIDVKATVEAQAQVRYQVRQMGSLGWCVIDTQDNDRKIRQGLSKKSDAERQLEDHILAMSK